MVHHVLRANIIKRVDNENVPASPKPSKTKSFLRHLNGASRRRRARTSGTPSSPRITVPQAIARRSHTKSPAASLRVNVSVADVADVEMGDDTVAPPNGHRVVNLPKELKRPAYKEVSKETLTTMDPCLASVDMGYIRENLQDCAPLMLRTLASVHAEPVRDVLPKELAIVINDMAFDPPTQLLAVYAQQPTPSSSKRKITLFPIHDVVFASHCASLPQLPRLDGEITDVPGGKSKRVTVPIVPMCLSSPQTFPALSHFLYTKNEARLLSTVFPCSTPSSHLDLLGGADSSSLREDFAKDISRTFTLQIILKHIMIVNGLWRNVCALGIFDDELWDVLDVAWEVLLLAFTLSCGDKSALTSLVGDEKAEEMTL